jgi:protein-tyrosine phosphatase
LLLARLMVHGVPVRVSSAGTRALVGQPMSPEAASLSLDYGGAPSAHRARQLTPQLVEEADLILTATRDQRGEVVSLAPATSRHTFTLRQFARIATSPDIHAAISASMDGADDGSPRSTLLSYVGAIAASRGYAPPPARAADDDIQDPYRQSKQVHRRVARSIDEAVTAIVTGMTSALTRLQ